MAAHCFTSDHSFVKYNYDPTRPESFVRRLLWKNSGILCLVTLLTLPIILGVAIGYIIVLGIVTTYRKITGQKSREEKECEAAKRTRIVLGHDLLETAFTKSVKLSTQQKNHVIQMPRYRLVNENSHVALPCNGNGAKEDTEREYEVERKIKEDEEEEEEEEEKKESEATRDRQDGADDNSENLEESLETSASYADISRTASASSEYYSTASEIEEPAKRQSCDSNNTTHRPKESLENQDEIFTGVHSESIVHNAMQTKENSGTLPQEIAPLVPKTELNCNPQIKASTFPSLGKLKYSIQYMKERNQLQVSILKAINLLDLSHDSPPSSYVKVCLLPQRFCWQRTKIIEETRNPMYNETFVISGFSHDRFGAYTLLICVVNAVSQWQRGHYGDPVIGEIFVPLINLTKHSNDEDKIMCDWAELKPKTTETPGSSKCGKINLALCYRPISGRLIVTVKKAKDLNCETKERFDPYVKLALYCDGTRVGRAATRVKRRLTNPVYNEKFNFDLTSDQIAYTTIVLKLVNNMDSTSGCLGATVIGYDSFGNGQEHWLCMMECLSQHVDAWHNLYN